MEVDPATAELGEGATLEFAGFDVATLAVVVSEGANGTGVGRVVGCV